MTFKLFGVILFSVIGRLVAGPVQAQSGQNNSIDLSRTALVIIDIQNFYFEGGKVPLTGSVEASLQGGGAKIRPIFKAISTERRSGRSASAGP